MVPFKHRAWRRIGLALASLVVTPFLITGVFRLLPFIPTYLGFLIAFLLCLPAVLSRRYRPLGVGVLMGAAIHAAFLWYLFSYMGRGLDQMG